MALDIKKKGPRHQNTISHRLTLWKCCGLISETLKKKCDQSLTLKMPSPSLQKLQRSNSVRVYTTESWSYITKLKTQAGIVIKSPEMSKRNLSAERKFIKVILFQERVSPVQLNRMNRNRLIHVFTRLLFISCHHV